jgi:hypothetical protein
MDGLTVMRRTGVRAKLDEVQDRAGCRSGGPKRGPRTGTLLQTDAWSWGGRFNLMHPTGALVPACRPGCEGLE